jgi:hypothetical protein
MVVGELLISDSRLHVKIYALSVSFVSAKILPNNAMVVLTVEY